MRGLFSFTSVLLLITGICSCDNFPRDAAGTLDKISGKTVHVGITSSTTHADSMLVQGFAEAVHADVVWMHGDQVYLTEQLSKHHIDMTIGGFTTDAPFEKIVAFTKPYKKTEDRKYVIAIPKGESALMVKLEQYIHAHGTE